MVSIYTATSAFSFNLNVNVIGTIEQSQSEEEINILFVGPTGTGKSNLINALCGRTVVVARRDLAAITTGVSMVQVVVHSEEDKVDNWKINFIDTQGVCDPEVSDEEVIRGIKSILFKTQMRIHRIVLVVKADRVVPQIRQSIARLIEAFDLENHKESILICLTHCDNLNQQAVNHVLDQFKQDPLFGTLYHQHDIALVRDQSRHTIHNLAATGIPNLEECDDDYKEFILQRQGKILKYLWTMFCFRNRTPLRIKKNSALYRLVYSMFSGRALDTYVASNEESTCPIS